MEAATMSRSRPQSPSFSPTSIPVDKSVLEDFAARRSIIEYRLLHLEPSDSDIDVGVDADADVDEDDSESTSPATLVLTIAAKIFSNLVFRKMTPNSLIHARLALRLRQAILSFDRHASSTHATCLLLWASVMGCMALRAGPLRTWFLGWVAHCVGELDICSETDLKYQLGKVVWIEGVLGGNCDGVWRELEELGAMGVEVRFVGDG
jgi:hypothetical protein